MMRLLVYTDKVTATGALMPALQESFSAADGYVVQKIQIDDIRHGILREEDARILFGPGIIGEDSHNQLNFSETEIDDIHHFLANRGGVLFAECAFSCFVSEITHYKSPTSQAKYLRSIRPLFKGKAEGVLLPYASMPDPETGLIMRKLSAVSFKTLSGAWEKTHILYGNGPRFIPNDPHDPDMEILMTYCDIPGNPAAALRLQIGRGSAYLCGPHPEVSPINIRPHNQPGLKRVLHLNDMLKPHEPQRQKLWNMFVHRIKQDIKP